MISLSGTPSPEMIGELKPFQAKQVSKGLAILLAINVVASALHFGDNMLRFRDYPEPAWITGPHVIDALWLLITP